MSRWRYLQTKVLVSTTDPTRNPDQMAVIFSSIILENITMQTNAMQQNEMKKFFITHDPIPRALNTCDAMNWMESTKYKRIHSLKILNMYLCTSTSLVQKLTMVSSKIKRRICRMQMEIRASMVAALISCLISMGLFWPMQFPILVMQQIEQPRQGEIMMLQMFEMATWAAICYRILKLPKYRVINSYMNRSKQKGMATQKHSFANYLYSWQGFSILKESIESLHVPYLCCTSRVRHKRQAKVMLVETMMPENPQLLLIVHERSRCSTPQVPNTYRMGLKISWQFRLLRMKSLVQKQHSPGNMQTQDLQENRAMASDCPVAFASRYEVNPKREKRTSRRRRFVNPCTMYWSNFLLFLAPKALLAKLVQPALNPQRHAPPIQ